MGGGDAWADGDGGDPETERGLTPHRHGQGEVYSTTTPLVAARRVGLHQSVLATTISERGMTMTQPPGRPAATDVARRSAGSTGRTTARQGAAVKDRVVADGETVASRTAEEAQAVASTAREQASR